MVDMIGIDIGGPAIKVGLVSAGGTITKSGKIPTEPEKGPEAAAERALQWFAEQGISSEESGAAGVACAGLIDKENGKIITSPNLQDWEGAPLADIFAARLSLPVTVENDASAAAYGEYRAGAGRGTKDFACITLGTGVGGGLVIDGRLHGGFRGLAGEIGHTIVMIDGPQCSCGNRGCLEALVGAGYIVERARRELESDAGSLLHGIEPLAVKDISQAASKGDRLAVGVLRRTGFYLGVGLCNLIHVLGPEVIAIGGGVAGAGDLILRPARETIREYAMHEVLTDIGVVAAELGNNAALIGVSLLAALEGGVTRRE
jgi:glucokinase